MGLHLLTVSLTETNHDLLNICVSTVNNILLLKCTSFSIVDICSNEFAFSFTTTKYLNNCLQKTNFSLVPASLVALLRAQLNTVEDWLIVQTRV